MVEQLLSVRREHIRKIQTGRLVRIYIINLEIHFIKGGGGKAHSSDQLRDVA